MKIDIWHVWMVAEDIAKETRVLGGIVLSPLRKAVETVFVATAVNTVAVSVVAGITLYDYVVERCLGSWPLPLD